MDIYPSYTYYLRWTSQNKSYYGVRTANKCSPEDDLWTHYFTSSKLVDTMREEHGEPDVILVDEVFQMPEDARSYELEFLRRNNWQSSEWLNQNCFPSINHTKESRRKIAETGRGRKHSEETRRKISESCKGRIFSEEHKRKISEGQKGKPKSPRSEETKRKIGSFHKNKTVSKETRLKLSKAHKGKKRTPFSEEHRRKLSEAAKKRHAKIG